MGYATNIIDRLVVSGVIPKDFRNEATVELHRELKRRSMRISQSLAMLASLHQLAMKMAGEQSA